MIVAVLILFGLCFGSFVNALVWRVHQQQTAKKGTESRYSILRGRSMCPHCHHELASMDLIPVLSWLLLRGKCRYCHKTISPQYPLVELSTAAVFVLSYFVWPGGVGRASDWLILITWLLSSVGLMALLVYDLKWMLLPSRILYPVALVAILGRAVNLIAFETDKLHGLLMWALSLLVASGIFWLLFEISRGKWIGFGDVRLGIITGTLLADPLKSFLMLFIASLLGTLIVLPSLVTRRRNLEARVPYGPFLIIAAAICLLYGHAVLDWYKSIAGIG